MAITKAQLVAAENAIQDVTAKRARLERLTTDVQTYVGGGPLSSELAELLRPFLADKLQTRLDAYAASIAQDVTAIQAVISDFE